MSGYKWVWAIVIAFFICMTFVCCSPVGRGLYNANQYAVQKVDDATNYKTKKQVEDSCRAMISTYTADKLTYEQYKDSEEKQKRSYAEQAKQRANMTASEYNNYVLTNGFVWAGNVPSDIKEELEYLE